MYNHSQICIDSLSKEVDLRFHKIAKSLAGGHPSSIAKAVFSEPSLRNHLMSRVVGVVNDKCAVLCGTSTQPVSPFKNIPVTEAGPFF